MSNTTSRIPMLLTLAAVFFAPSLLLAAPAALDEPVPDLLSPTPTPTVTVSHLGGRSIALEATAGYGAYFSPLGYDQVHGPMVNAALLVSWGSWPQLTIRIEGSYGRMSGRGEYWGWADEKSDYEISRADLAVFHGGLQASWKNGLWLGAGFGALYYNTVTGSTESDSSYLLPELVMQAGYNLPLGKAMALQLSAEAASGVFTLNLRVQARCGLLVRF